MYIQNKTIQDCQIFSIEGNIEIYSTEDLRLEIVDYLEGNNTSKVIINLEGVDFIDSSGLGMLMNVQFKFKETTQFRFCNMKDNIKLAIEYTNLNGFFKIDPDEETAINNFEWKTLIK